MNVDDWLKQNIKKLQAAGIATARLDALILLEDVTGKDRAWLLAHPETSLQGKALQKLEEQIERRARHEPLAYIRGKSEFYGREFKVTPATLQPRPETETMIDLLKQIYQGGGQRAEGGVITDIGTGSGCLAITAKLEFPKATVCAIEINEDALEVAKENAQKLGADVKFHQGNLLEPISALCPLPSAPFAILANLPYVPDSHTINQAAMQEPAVAIFGGEDGLDLYRELFAQLSRVEGKGPRAEVVLTESLPFQHEALAKIASQAGYRLKRAEDFIQVFTKV